MVDAKLFQALSDSTRLDILSLLAAGPINVSRIVAHLGCAQPAVSRHLRVLRETSLIGDRRKGKEVEYSINPDAVATAIAYLKGLSTAGTPTKPGIMAAGKKSAGARRPGASGAGRVATPETSGDHASKGEAAKAEYAVERRPSAIDDFLL